MSLNPQTSHKVIHCLPTDNVINLSDCSDTLIQCLQQAINDVSNLNTSNTDVSIRLCVLKEVTIFNHVKDIVQ